MIRIITIAVFNTRTVWLIEYKIVVSNSWNHGKDTFYYHTLSLNSYTDKNLKYRLAFKFIMKKYIIGNIFQLLSLISNHPRTT